MAVSIEDILLARAQQDEANRIGATPAALLGASLGATAGYRATAPSSTDKLVEELDNFSKKKKKGKTSQRMTGRSRGGRRMAGGLVGAILGGGLGVGTRQAMMQNSPAADLLAKLQVNGSLTYADKQKLQGMLADSYSNSTLAM